MKALPLCYSQPIRQTGERLNEQSHRFMQNTGLFHHWLGKYQHQPIHPGVITNISKKLSAEVGSPLTITIMDT
jgi:hypothetical protein